MTLKERFEEIIHMGWDEFMDLEKSGSATVDDQVLCSLVRACAESDDILAIKLAFDRIDGLQETPIEVKIPKFYIRYVNAKKIESSQKAIQAPQDNQKEEKSNYDPATAKLRETLREMRKMPRDVVRMIRIYKRRVEKGNNVEHMPKVKSIICANLLKNVAKGRFKAIELVFDQIDGKLTRTITLLGGQDMYVDDYSLEVAPAHAIKGEDGVYYAEDILMKNQWIRGFAQNNKGLEMLTEGLSDD
jgi:hypothetical protein